MGKKREKIKALEERVEKLEREVKELHDWWAEYGKHLPWKALRDEHVKALASNARIAQELAGLFTPGMPGAPCVRLTQDAAPTDIVGEAGEAPYAPDDD